MSSSTTKKVYLRRFSDPTLEGYVNRQTYIRPKYVEILDRSAQVTMVPLESVKSVYFVREFSVDMELQQKTTFSSRPKQPGLWIRLSFRDGDLLEGVVRNNMLLMENAGITITPPDPRSHAQEVFVPRNALDEITVLGVVGRSAVRRKRSPQVSLDSQMNLFR